MLSVEGLSPTVPHRIHGQPPTLSVPALHPGQEAVLPPLTYTQQCWLSSRSPQWSKCHSQYMQSLCLVYPMPCKSSITVCQKYTHPIRKHCSEFEPPSELLGRLTQSGKSRDQGRADRRVINNGCLPLISGRCL